MNYAAIKTNDIANGPGIRVSLFVSGCSHHCEGCFQPETWDFSYGNTFNEETEQVIMEALDHDYISGLTLLGGEPMERVNVEVLLPFLIKIRNRYPHKTIWCYSGYTFEKLVKDTTKVELLKMVDVLVDGEFVLSLKNISLTFRGSSNQRILDVPESLIQQKAVCIDKYM